MAMTLTTNMPAVKNQRRLTQSVEKLQKSTERLSSGKRINRSADDAAGLAVSERIRARLRSLDVARRNAGDAISYIQTAEGGLNEVTNIVVRMRELTSQAASDTLGNRERSFLNKEFQQLRQEIGRIVETTEFNGTRVLQAGENERAMQIFVGASNRGKSLEGESRDFSENDPDVLEISLSELRDFETALGDVINSDIAIVPQDEKGGARDLGPTGTNQLFEILDNSINSVSSYRATLGAVQARVNSAVANIDISTENLMAARSRIVDVDYASETAKYSQAQILSQSGIAMQSQANQQPEMILSLLR